MSILHSNSSSSKSNNNMSSSFQVFKRQASFFLKEKINNARLAFTDVTPAQLLAEEATDGNGEGGPDTRTLKIISKAAFEVDDYWRIVEILHKKLENFDKSNWRAAYKALIVLEHLLCHGPESVAEEFQSDRDVISTKIGNFQHIDEKAGFNWGLNVRKKSERIVKLLGNRVFLKEERNRVRKISRGIQGFGSFSFSGEGTNSSPKQFDRCHSEPNNAVSSSEDDDIARMNHENRENNSEYNNNNNNKSNNSSSWGSLCDDDHRPSRDSSIEWEVTAAGESSRLLDKKKVEYNREEEEEEDEAEANSHPFTESDHLIRRALQAC